MSYPNLLHALIPKSPKNPGKSSQMGKKFHTPALFACDTQTSYYIPRSLNLPKKSPKRIKNGENLHIQTLFASLT
jgi:hypothetical protein